MRSFDATSDRFGKLGNRIVVSCIFVDNGTYYLIESVLRHSIDALEGALVWEIGVLRTFSRLRMKRFGGLLRQR